MVQIIGINFNLILIRVDAGKALGSPKSSYNSDRERHGELSTLHAAPGANRLSGASGLTSMGGNTYRLPPVKGSKGRPLSQTFGSIGPDLIPSPSEGHTPTYKDGEQEDDFDLYVRQYDRRRPTSNGTYPSEIESESTRVTDPRNQIPY